MSFSSSFINLDKLLILHPQFTSPKSIKSLQLPHLSEVIIPNINNSILDYDTLNDDLSHLQNVINSSEFREGLKRIYYYFSNLDQILSKIDDLQFLQVLFI